MTLGAELNYVRNYVELQKSMTGRPVVCEIQEEEGAADFLVPTLCVQTFVENSVKYAKLGAPGLELFYSGMCAAASDGGRRLCGYYGVG